MPSIRLNTPTLRDEYTYLFSPSPSLSFTHTYHSLSFSLALFPPHNVARRDARLQRVSECRRSFSHAGTLDGITAENSNARAMSITARNHIRRRAANAIRMKYEIPSAKIFTTLRIRRVEARERTSACARTGKRRKNFPLGTRRHKAIRRSNKRVNNRAVVAVRAFRHSLRLFFSLFLSVHLSLFHAAILSLSRNRTSIKRCPLFNRECIKRDGAINFSPTRCLFVEETV